MQLHLLESNTYSIVLLRVQNSTYSGDAVVAI